MKDTGAVGSTHSIVHQVQLYVVYKHKWKIIKAQMMILLLMMLSFTAVTFLIHVTSEHYGLHKFLSVSCF